jgi:hypothetical protein
MADVAGNVDFLARRERATYIAAQRRAEERGVSPVDVG